MNLKVFIDGEQATDSGATTIRIPTLAVGDARSPQTAIIQVNRKMLAGGRNAAADQLLFPWLTGNGRGEIQRRPVRVELLDPQTNSVVGTFAGDACAGSYQNDGNETVTMRVNDLKYTLSNGQQAMHLDVMRPEGAIAPTGAPAASQAPAANQSWKAITFKNMPGVSTLEIAGPVGDLTHDLESDAPSDPVTGWIKGPPSRVRLRLTRVVRPSDGRMPFLDAALSSWSPGYNIRRDNSQMPEVAISVWDSGALAYQIGGSRMLCDRWSCLITGAVDMEELSLVLFRPFMVTAAGERFECDLAGGELNR